MTPDKVRKDGGTGPTQRKPRRQPQKSDWLFLPLVLQAALWHLKGRPRGCVLTHLTVVSALDANAGEVAPGSSPKPVKTSQAYLMRFGLGPSTVLGTVRHHLNAVNFT